MFCLARMAEHPGQGLLCQYIFWVHPHAHIGGRTQGIHEFYIHPWSDTSVINSAGRVKYINLSLCSQVSQKHQLFTLQPGDSNTSVIHSLPRRIKYISHLLHRENQQESVNVIHTMGP
jgi:hypothetical protein